MSWSGALCGPLPPRTGRAPPPRYGCCWRSLVALIVILPWGFVARYAHRGALRHPAHPDCGDRGHGAPSAPGHPPRSFSLAGLAACSCWWSWSRTRVRWLRCLIASPPAAWHGPAPVTRCCSSCWPRLCLPRLQRHVDWCALRRPRRPSARGVPGSAEAAGHARCRPAGSGRDGPFRFAAALSRDRARWRGLASDGEHRQRHVIPGPLTRGGPVGQAS